MIKYSSVPNTLYRRNIYLRVCLCLCACACERIYIVSEMKSVQELNHLHLTEIENV